jgi:HemY protein
MIRFVSYLLLLMAAAFGLAWLAERPGTVTVNWLGAEAEVSVFSAGVMLVLAVLALFFVLWLILSVISAPRRLGAAFRRRRERLGMLALQEGIFAVGAGDVSAASRAARIANKFVPNQPLVRLLRAQSAQLTGDRTAAQRIFTSMLDDPSSKQIALRGLFLEAKRENHHEAAQHFAREALVLNPSLSWPVTAQFEHQCQTQDWNGALNTLNVARNHRAIDRRTANRRRAVLLTALAMEAEAAGDLGKVQELALEAHKLRPDLVPSAAIAGRALAAAGNTAKAARVLSAAWEFNPHPDLAIVYAYARPGDSTRDRLARVKILAQATPGHPEAAIAVAQAAVDAREWDEARRALDFLVNDRPSARVCTLMARIEHGQSHDAGRVREWLARALKAPRDPVWIADGVISSDWAPLSPVTGALDAYVWAVPPERMNTAVQDDRLLDELARFEAEVHAEETIQAAPLKPAVTEVRAEPAPLKATAPQKPAIPAEIAPKLKAPAAPAPKPEPADPPAVLPAALPSSASGWEPGPVEKPAAKAPPPAAGPAQKPAQSGKTAPMIFVPTRPPDDPGPDVDDSDEMHTALSRFRSPLKGQA